MLLKKLTLILLLTTLLWSCKKDQRTHWDTEWYGPLAHGSINISDVLDDSLTYTQNQNVWLQLNRNIYTLKADSLFSFPDEIGSVHYQIPLNLTILPGELFIDLSKTVDIKAADAELTSASLKHGRIYVHSKSTYKVPVEYIYTFPGILKNGQPLQITSIVPAADNGTLVLENSYTISDCELDLTGKTHDRYNKIHYMMQARNLPDGDTLFMSPQDSFAMNIRFEDLEISAVGGYFGQKELSMSDTTGIRLFESIQTGLIDLDSVKALLTIENGLGADMILRLNELSSINRSGGKQVKLNADIIGSGIHISRAVKQSTIQATYKNIDLTTSNMDAFIENLPDRIGFDIAMKLNPMGNISMGNDFYDSSTPLSMDFELELPLKLSLEALTFVDTLEVSVTGDLDMLTSAKLNLISENYFPVDAELKAWAISENAEQTLPITGSNSIISAGIPDAQHMVQSPMNSTISLELTPGVLQLLRENGRILLQVKLDTYGLEKLSIYDHYRIDYQITGKAGIRINE